MLARAPQYALVPLLTLAVLALLAFTTFTSMRMFASAPDVDATSSARVARHSDPTLQDRTL